MSLDIILVSCWVSPLFFFQLTPSTGELRKVHLELGLSKALAIAKRAGWVGDALELSLRGNIILNMALQFGAVLVVESVHDAFED